VSTTRVLHITDRLSSRGGADWHLLGVLEHQHKAPDYEVLLATARDDGTAPAPCPVELLPELDGPKPDDALTDIAKRFSPDLVHLHNLLEPRVMRWASRFPCVMTVQDHRAFCPGRGKLTLHDKRCTSPMDEQLCVRCFDSQELFQRRLVLTRDRLEALQHMSVVVLSQYMMRELVDVGLHPSKVHVVPPFVHRLPEATPSKHDCVLFAGRLVHAKGVFDAIEAHHRSGVELPLVFAGTGSLRNELEARGHHVTGWLSHEELVGWYARAAALIFAPRWQEPFGIAGIEAMHFGVPVVAWDSGGIEEWHPQSPPLARWGDIEGLAQSLRTAVEMRLDWADPYRPAELMTKLHGIYGQTLPASPRSRV